MSSFAAQRQELIRQGASERMAGEVLAARTAIGKGEIPPDAINPDNPPALGGLRPTATERFAAMTPAEQDEAFGPATAEALRSGKISFADLVQRNRFDGDADNFITQRPLKDAE